MKRIFTFLFLAASTIHSNAQTCNPLDQSFGVAGKVTGFSSSGYVYSDNIIVQPDNKIIQIGSSSGSNNYRFTLVRDNSNGSIDGSFGQNGKVITGIGEHDYAKYGVLQDDGKIVVGGYTYNGSYHSDIVLVRYNADGSLDSGFGVGGKVIRSLGPNNNLANAVAVQPDGKIIVAGSIEGNCFTDCNGLVFCSPAFGVARFNGNGSIDSSFGQNGIVTTNVGSANAGTALSVILQPDGKIVVAGHSLYDYGCDYYGGYYFSSAFSMVRYHPNGVRDSLFGANGIVSDSLNMTTTRGIALQAAGKIVVIGPDRGGGYVTKQYNADGSLDNSFGQQGKVIIDNGWLYSLATLPNGKIVMAGGMNRDGRNNFQVIRLANDGSFDNSFNGNGRVFFHPGASGSNDVATAIALQGEHIVAGGYSNNNPTYSLLVVRLLDSLPGLSVVITPTGTLTPCQGE